MAHARIARLLAAGAVVAGATAALAGPAMATPGGGNWERVIRPALSRQDLGLPVGASVRRLAAGAIVRSAPRLARGGELGGLRFVGEPLTARNGRHALRFTQRLDGLRVLWSEYDVAVARGEVTSIAGTVVPLRSTRLAGEVKLTAARAKAIGLAAAPGEDESARTPELVAYAGSPDRPRAPRRAFVVDVAPASFAEDVASDLCVVVDAQTGSVLATWRGSAARKPQRPGDVAGAPARVADVNPVTLVQGDDAQGTTRIVSNSRLEAATFRSPYEFVFEKTLSFGGPFNTAFGTAFVNALPVSRFFCLFRQYCGRDSGQPGPVGGGTFNRNFFTLNWAAPPGVAGQYHADIERILIDADVSAFPGIIAHEYGHMIDFHMKNDDVATFESKEVAEALADMFALDFELSVASPTAAHPTFVEQVTDPDVHGHPYHYSQYDCSTGDEHDNGWILDRVYLKLTSAFGVSKAGRLLQGVPWMLPPGRTFATVKRAFMNVASWTYGAGSAEVAKIDALFGRAGINTVTSNRASTCPGRPA